jgi:hypothetical protein
LNAPRWAACLLLLTATSATPARDIFVDNSTGDDRFRGEALLVTAGRGPVRTLQKAVRIAKPGDRIVVAPTGVAFQEEVVINGVGRESPTADFPIVIEGNGAVLDGLVPIDPLFARHLGGGLYLFETTLGPTHTSDVLFVDGVPAPRGAGRWASGMPMLNPGEFAVWNGRMCYQAAPNDYLDRHTFAVSRLNVGMTIYRSNHWIIRNLHFRGYRLDGVRLHGPAQGLVFQYCKFLDNGRAGFAAYGLAEAGVQDSESLGNGKAGIVGRNLAALGLVRVRATGSPTAIDSDPTARTRVTAGDPQPPPAAPPRRPARPSSEETGREPPLGKE